jgi:hypothetical protein
MCVSVCWYHTQLAGRADAERLPVGLMRGHGAATRRLDDRWPEAEQGDWSALLQMSCFIDPLDACSGRLLIIGRFKWGRDVTPWAADSRNKEQNVNVFVFSKKFFKKRRRRRRDGRDEKMLSVHLTFLLLVRVYVEMPLFPLTLLRERGDAFRTWNLRRFCCSLKDLSLLWLSIPPDGRRCNNSALRRWMAAAVLQGKTWLSRPQSVDNRKSFFLLRPVICW